MLDISKLRMYRLHYEELERYRTKFNCHINIVAGDTDSFFFECVNVNLKKELLPVMIADKLLDTSNYPANNPLYSVALANAIGKFKDESAGIHDYVDWIFLRPKLYSLHSNVTTVKAKGINTRQSPLTHANFVAEYESLNNDDDNIEKQPTMVKQRRIGSINHQLYTFESTKIALSAVDDKRVWFEQNSSLAYGHYLLHETS